MTTHRSTFVGGSTGLWRVVSMNTVAGLQLQQVQAIEIVTGQLNTLPHACTWMLHGATSYERYVHRNERTMLDATEPPLGRSQATCAALIPISKSLEWWELAQDERRKIVEDQSHHISTGLRYLPAIARRLYHGRDIGAEFDFLTWFEFAPEHTNAFDELVGTLHQSEEWRYVEREIDIRLVRT